jgi:group I intron endonuclease
MYLTEEQRKLCVSGVYKIVNTINGKIYVGSSVNIRKRWVQHKWDLKNGRHRARHLVAAWNKYGHEAFQFEIIESGKYTKQELIAAEQKWIDLLRPFDPEVGYNQQTKADSRLGLRHRPETIEKFRVPKTKGHAINISKGQSFFKGQKLEELIELRSQGWSSIKLAAHFGCNKSCVLRTLNGRQTVHWYLRDPLPKSKWNTGQKIGLLTNNQAHEARCMYFEGAPSGMIAKHFKVRRTVVEQIFSGKSYKSTKLDFSNGRYY